LCGVFFPNIEKIGEEDKRVGIFAENIRDNFTFDPIEVQPHSEKPGKYRILDGVHRWSAYKATGVLKPEVILVNKIINSKYAYFQQ